MTKVINESTIKRARLPNTAAPNPTMPKLIFCTLELMMACTSNFERSIQRAM